MTKRFFLPLVLLWGIAWCGCEKPSEKYIREKTEAAGNLAAASTAPPGDALPGLALGIGRDDVAALVREGLPAGRFYTSNSGDVYIEFEQARLRDHGPWGVSFSYFNDTLDGVSLVLAGARESDCFEVYQEALTNTIGAPYASIDGWSIWVRGPLVTKLWYWDDDNFQMVYLSIEKKSARNGDIVFKGGEWYSKEYYESNVRSDTTFNLR